MVQIFCPLTTYSSPSRTARVRSEARSEPAPGSEKPWHQTTSPLRIGVRWRAFCSSLPCTMSAGPSMLMPTLLPTPGALAEASSALRMYCSIQLSPPPPYSRGQWGATQPFSAKAENHSSAAWRAPSSSSSRSRAHCV